MHDVCTCTSHTHAKYIPMTIIAVILLRYVFTAVGDENGLQPIHEAAGHNQLNCLKYLIKKGAKNTAVDNQNRTPLHMV